jgi:hypothetical protein
MELVATDPEHYLDIVQNYTHMRDGRKIYLPDLFNIIVNRMGGRLSIKFKMSDNTQWHEIGFNGGNFDDQAVYKAFSEKVTTLIRNPTISRRDFLSDTMRPEVKAAPAMVNQGNQYALNKIDRFLGRTVHAIGEPSEVNTSQQQKPAPVDVIVNTPQQQKPAPVDKVTSHVLSDPMLDVVIQSYKGQLRARLDGTSASEESVTGLPRPTDCPTDKQADYVKLLSLINSQSQFVKDLVESLPRSTAGQRLLVTDFLYDFESIKTDEQLADQLNLSATDRKLLQTYDIKLTAL